MRAFNRPVPGFIIGLVMPLLGFLVVYLFWKNDGQSISGFIAENMHNARPAALIISLSILANAVPFAYFNSKRMDYGARGVFIATMLFAVLIIWLKVVA